MCGIQFPLINIESFRIGDVGAQQHVAHQIEQACEEIGFFTIAGHGVSAELLADLHTASRAFFDLSLTAKNVVQAAHYGQRLYGRWYGTSGR